MINRNMLLNLHPLKAIQRLLVPPSVATLLLCVLTCLLIDQLSLSSQPAKAYEEQRQTRCWSLVGNKFKFDGICTLKLVSWAGGGLIQLYLTNGQKHDIAFGLQGRGGNPCPVTNHSLNGVCGRNYYRDPASAAELSSAQGQSLLNQRRQVMICIAAKTQSICYGR